MSNYNFKVKAILDAATIQDQLNKLGENFKPINIDLAKSIDLNKIADQLNAATLAGAKLNESGKVTSARMKAIGDSFDVVATATEKGTDINLNFESSQKRAAKSAQAEADAFVKGAKAKQAEQEKMQRLWDANAAKQEKSAQAADTLYTKNQQSIHALTIRVEGLTDAQKARINAEQQLKEISAETDIKKQAVLIQGFTKDLSAVSYGMMNFASSIDYTMKRFMEIGAITLAFRTIKNVVSDMVKTVSELDASLVEVQKVTDLTGKSLETFTDRAFSVGSEVARTGKEVIDATAIFARSGYEIEDALDLSKVAMIMMNVGDGIDSTSEAATSLISVLKGYNLAANEAIKVTDLINEVSNNAAINFEDLTEGLTRTSAVFNQAGVSIEKLSGLLTGTNEILQNVEMSSTGLITISQRLRGITEVGEDGAVATSKLATKFKEIANIDIFDQYGQLRDTYSILEDMARVFPSLTKNQRQYLSELAAGKKQVKVLESLLTNWNGVEKAVKAATNSAGSAEKENSKYINSIAGKVKALESSIQKLSVATVDDNFIKWLLDIAKGFVDFQTSLGGLMPLVSALVLLFSSKLAPALDSVFKILKTSIVGMKAYSAANVAAAASTEVVGTAAQVSATKVMMLQKALGWISLAFTVVSAGIGVWNNYKKAQEDARIESVEAGVAAAEQSSSLDDLYSSIKSLSEVQNRTEEQESSLLQLNSEIIEKLGKRKGSLADLTVGSKEYTAALKEQIIEEAKSNEAQLRKSKADAEQALKSDIPSRGFLAVPLKFDYEDVGKDLRNQLVKIFNEGSKTSAGKWFDFYVDRLDSSTISTLKYYDALLTAKKAIDEESNSLNAAGKIAESSNLLQTESYKDLTDEISRYSEYIDNYLKATLNVEINNRRINGTLPTTVDGFKSFKEEMLKSYGVLGEYSDEFGELIDYLFPALSGKVGDATWKLEESNKVVEDAKTKTKLLNDEIDSLQSAYKTLESVVDEYNKTGSLSLDSVQSILSLGDEYLKYLTDENGQLVLNKDGLQNLAIARLDELKASAMRETASKLQYLIDEKTLTDGVTESVKALKIEELEELVVQAGNSEEAQALMDALQIRLSLIDDLIEKNGLLTGTESNESEEVNTLTDALKEQNTAIDALQSAYDTISDAVTEYSENGVLSIDTLQKILSMEPEYLQYLYDENGQLQLNKEVLEELAQVKLDELSESLQSLKDNGIITAEQYDALKTVIEQTTVSMEESKEQTNDSSDSFKDQSDALDDAQSAYETLSEAIEEYNKNGVLSVDTLQSLLSLSPEYLQMFFDQAGALGDAEAATMAHVEALKQAKINELAAAAAAQILAVSQEAAGGAGSGATSGLSSFGSAAINMGSDAVSSAGNVKVLQGAVYDLQQQLGTSVSVDWANDQIKGIVSNFNKIADEIGGLGTSFTSSGGSSGGRGGGGGGSSRASQQAQAIADAYDKLLDTTMKMIKAQKEDQIEALEDELDLEEKLYKAEKKRLEDQIDKYKDVIDAKQKALKLDKEQSEYDDEIADKNKEISDIQNRLTELEFDTSASAMAEKLKLQEDLTGKQKDLSKSQADREYDLTNQALDDEYEAYKTSQETQIDLLEQGFEATKTDYEDRIQLLKDYLEEEGTIRTDALNMMNTKSAEFYNNLFAWNAKYGDVTNATLQSIIDKAYEVVSITSGSSKKKKKTVSSKKPPTGSAITVGSVAIAAGSVVGTIGAIIGSLIGTHHDGLDSGFVGGGLKGNEEFIKALKGEVYATPKQQNEYMEKYLPNMLKNAYVGGMTNVSAGTTMQYDKLLEINVSGSVDSNSVSKIQDTVNQAFGQLTNALSQRGTVRKANAFAT